VNPLPYISLNDLYGLKNPPNLLIRGKNLHLIVLSEANPLYFLK